MKAARLHEYDENVSPGSLKIEEVDEPRIEGPLDVLVRIGAAGLCRTDIHVVEGQWKELVGVELPYTLGHENAGWVEEVGSAVTNVEVGDAVVLHPFITCGLCRPCRAGDDMHCVAGVFPGIDADGGFAELLKTNARAVVKLPEGVEPKDVAAHADAGLTAYHAVKKAQAVLYPGTRAVVIGAGGGLGHIGVQCLKALTPAEIIAVDTREESLEFAKELGADQTVKVEDGKHVQSVLEMTEGKGAEVVFDYVGERGAEDDAWKMTRQAGSHFVIGYGGTVEVPTIDIISTERSITGNLVGTYNDLAELMILTAQGKVSLHTSTYPLDAVNDAIQDLNTGHLQGRGILIPDGAST
jgi:NAD+-dependent secondary alcohol dehydrogenase Adh1